MNVELTHEEQVTVLDALRHSIRYAQGFLDHPTAPWIVEIWQPVQRDSFALYKKLGGTFPLEELK